MYRGSDSLSSMFATRKRCKQHLLFEVRVHRALVLSGCFGLGARAWGFGLKLEVRNMGQGEQRLLEGYKMTTKDLGFQVS